MEMRKDFFDRFIHLHKISVTPKEALKYFEEYSYSGYGLKYDLQENQKSDKEEDQLIKSITMLQIIDNCRADYLTLDLDEIDNIYIFEDHTNSQTYKGLEDEARIIDAILFPDNAD